MHVIDRLIYAYTKFEVVLLAVLCIDVKKSVFTFFIHGTFYVFTGFLFFTFFILKRWKMAHTYFENQNIKVYNLRQYVSQFGCNSVCVFRFCSTVALEYIPSLNLKCPGI